MNEIYFIYLVIQVVRKFSIWSLDFGKFMCKYGKSIQLSIKALKTFEEWCYPVLLRSQIRVQQGVGSNARRKWLQWPVRVTGDLHRCRQVLAIQGILELFLLLKCFKTTTQRYREGRQKNLGLKLWGITSASIGGTTSAFVRILYNIHFLLPNICIIEHLLQQ